MHLRYRAVAANKKSARRCSSRPARALRSPALRSDSLGQQGAASSAAQAVLAALPSIAVTACVGLTGAIARLKPRATSNSKRTCIQRSSLLHPLLLEPSTHKLMHMCICTNTHMLELARVHLHGYRNHSASQHECRKRGPADRGSDSRRCSTRGENTCVAK